MKLGYNEVLEVSVFDENGSLVTTLDTLKSSSIVLGVDGVFRLVINDALLDDKLLKFLGKEEKDESTDFDKYLKKQKYGTTITFSQYIDKNCKLIGRGLLRNSSDMTDREFIFEIPKARTGKSFEIGKDYERNTMPEFELIFEAQPFNDQEDSFRMHIE